MKNTLIRYGLIGGAIVSILMLVTLPLFNFPEDYTIAEVSGYVTIILSLSAVFMAIKSYRDKYNGGVISFGKAFLIGLYITLIAGSIYALSFIVYNEVSDTSCMMDGYRAIEVEKVNKMDIAENEKAEKIAEIDKNIKLFSHPVALFLVGLLGEYTPPGIIISLIAAAILRRKDKEPRIITETRTL